MWISMTAWMLWEHWMEGFACQHFLEILLWQVNIKLKPSLPFSTSNRFVEHKHCVFNSSHNAMKILFPAVGQTHSVLFPLILWDGWIALVGVLAFNPIMSSATPSYCIPHCPLINTVLVLTAAISVTRLALGCEGKNDPASVYSTPTLLSKIGSFLLEVWLRLLMSTSVAMPSSWTLWQIIFTGSQMLPFPSF